MVERNFDIEGLKALVEITIAVEQKVRAEYDYEIEQIYEQVKDLTEQKDRYAATIRELMEARDRQAETIEELTDEKVRQAKQIADIRRENKARQEMPPVGDGEAIRSEWERSLNWAAKVGHEGYGHVEGPGKELYDLLSGGRR